MQLPQLLEFVANHWELVLIFLGILAFLSYDMVAGNKDSLDPLDAVNIINHQDALVVDVRTVEEFSKGHIIHAMNIPSSGLLKQLQLLEKHRERPLILNCNSGARSAQACKQLRKNGFTKVYNLRGGILAWENASLPISKKSR